MTIKELYEYALENGLENYCIYVNDKEDTYPIYETVSFEIDHSFKNITLQ